MTPTPSPERPNWLNPPRAKTHPLLDSLGAQLGGTTTSETFEVSGHKYTLRTLSPLEESWADGFVAGENLYQAGRNRRAPYVAASLEAIDGTSVRELFVLPENTPDDMKETYARSPEAISDWRRREVLRWVREVMPPPVLAELWVAYQELEKKRTEALEKIGPLSRRSLSPESLLTSLLGNPV